MLWIGHPWLSVRYEGSLLVISEPHDSDTPTARWAVDAGLLDRAVDAAEVGGDASPVDWKRSWWGSVRRIMPGGSPVARRGWPESRLEEAAGRIHPGRAATSGEMLPRPPAHDRHDVLARHPKPDGQLARLDALDPHPTDLDHVTRAPWRSSASPSPAAMPQRVVGVRLVRAPTQVRQVVVRAVAVAVTGDISLGTGADERLKDQPMDASGRLLAAPGEVDASDSPGGGSASAGANPRQDAEATTPSPAGFDLVRHG